MGDTFSLTAVQRKDARRKRPEETLQTPREGTAGVRPERMGRERAIFRREQTSVKSSYMRGGTSFSRHSGIVTAVDRYGTVHATAAHEEVIGPDDSPSALPAEFSFLKENGSLKS